MKKLLLIFMFIVLTGCISEDYVGTYRTQLEQAGYSDIKILDITMDSVYQICGTAFRFSVAFTGKKNGNYVKAYYCVGKYEGGIINILQTEIPTVDTTVE